MAVSLQQGNISTAESGKNNYQLATYTGSDLNTYSQKILNITNMINIIDQEI